MKFVNRWYFILWGVVLVLIGIFAWGKGPEMCIALAGVTCLTHAQNFFRIFLILGGLLSIGYNLLYFLIILVIRKTKGNV